MSENNAKIIGNEPSEKSEYYKDSSAAIDRGT